MKLNALSAFVVGAFVVAGTSATASTVIFSDNFNRPSSNLVNANISPNPWYDAIEDDSNDVAIRGNQLRLRDTVSGEPDAAVSSVLIDARGMTNTILSFDWRALGPNESSDDLYVSFDRWGNESLEDADTAPGWVQAFQGSDSGTSWMNEEISIGGADGSLFRLAFWTDVSTSTEGFMIDNVSVVSTVPVPASSLLLLGGMGAFAAIRRRKSKKA